MSDYKEMYFKLFRACEEAVSILILAQQKCEEHYISSPEPELTMITLPIEKKRRIDSK